MFGSPSFPALDPAFSQQITQPTAPPPPKKGGMFAGGQIDLGRAIAGYLAGIGNPAGAQALQAMNERRREQERLAQEQQQYQRERQDKRSDFTFEQDYKTAHAGPDDFTARIQELEALHPGLGMQYAQTYARNGGGLGLVTNPVTGEQYAQRPASPPAEAVARLKANPAEAQQFDEIFGPGSSAGILGGPTQPASGGFPGH